MNLISSAIHCPSSLPDLEDQLDLLVDAGAQSLLILAAHSPTWHCEQIISVISKYNIPIVGGIFPQVLLGDQAYDEGFVVAALNCPLDIVCINHLSSGDESIAAQLLNNREKLIKAKTHITLIDGLAANIERLVECMYELMGLNVTAVGGGAGALDFVQRPCLFTREGALEDAAIIAGVPSPIHLGVAHGWEVMEGPYLVTGSEQNMLTTLNYTPAFEIYREKVEAASGERFDDTNFFSIAKTYPLGIEGLDGSLTVRDPINLRGTKLMCVGEVPQNSTVYILKGRREGLIKAAGVAAATAYNAYRRQSATTPYSGLLFDCISRSLFLESQFEQELALIQHTLGDNGICVGALTLGEISNTSNGIVSLLNKSTVIGVL